MKPGWQSTGWIAFLVTVLLTASLVGVTVASLEGAQWVAQSWRYVNGLWLGALSGLALAHTRFRGRLALAYSLVIGLLLAGEAAGRIGPDPASLGALTWSGFVQGLNVRTLTFADQVRGWIQTWAAGGTIRDQAVFILVMSWGLWQVGAWLSWSVFRRRAALEGLLPLGMVLALNAQLAARPANELALGLSLTIGLIAHTAYVRARAHWDRRGVDYAEAIDQDWGLTNIPVTLLVSGLVLAAPLVGTPQGWQTLGSLFFQAGQQTADTASRLFAGVNPPRQAAAFVTARLPDLAHFDQPLPRGDDSLMWVTLSDPAPPPTEAGAPAPSVRSHYWRSQVYSTYTGVGWETASAVSGAADFPAAPPAGRYALTQHFQIAAAHGPDLFAVNLPVSVTEDAHVQALPAEMDAVLTGGASDYTVTSWATNLSGQALANTPTEYPAAIRAAYLQLPANLPQRVRDLAAHVAAGADTPYAIALRVQDYLRVNYPYQLDPPPPPAGRDVVDYFLFEAPGGFCTYYASAMTVMLRARGVPARVAAGFAMGEFDQARRAWRVPARDAHAWVEVYFPGDGWVEFEPTPSQARVDYGGVAPVASLPAAPARPAAENASGWPAWLGPGLIAVLIAGALWWRLRQREAGLDPASVTYWRMRAELARAGLSAPPSTTPDEFLAACASALAERPTLRAALNAATRLYVEARYGERPPSAEAAGRIDAEWHRARGDRLQVWWRSLQRRR